MIVRRSVALPPGSRRERAGQVDCSANALSRGDIYSGTHIALAPYCNAQTPGVHASNGLALILTGCVEGIGVPLRERAGGRSDDSHERRLGPEVLIYDTDVETTRHAHADFIYSRSYPNEIMFERAF